MRTHPPDRATDRPTGGVEEAPGNRVARVPRARSWRPDVPGKRARPAFVARGAPPNGFPAEISTSCVRQTSRAGAGSVFSPPGEGIGPIV